MGVNIITVDLETYYDREYSLSKMTTEAYVRDPRFEVIGMGIKVNDTPTVWCDGKNVAKVLKSIDFSDKAILAHNTAFDGAILSWHFGVKPKLWLDTLSMARPFHNSSVGGSLKALVEHYELGAKGTEVVNALGKRREDFTAEELARYGEYCINDVDLTRALFKKLAPKVPASELAIIDLTLRMYTEPVLEIDVDLLNRHLATVQIKKANLIASLGLGGEEKETRELLMSNPKFAEILKGFGVDPPTKVSLRTGKEAWAFSKTDKDFLALLEHEDECVSAAVAARLGVKTTIEETRTQALLGVAQRGQLPILLNYFGAHTGRFSGGDKMNLQNLPRGGALRKALRAPEGMKLIACDSAQIEARMVAWLAGQEDLVAAFRDARDIYCEFASEVYGRPITKADKLERFVGKTCILGLGFGMGAEKFRKTLEIGQGGVSVKFEEEDSQRIVKLYRQTYPRIVGLWYECGDALRIMADGGSDTISGVLAFDKNKIFLPNGLHLTYPHLQADDKSFRYISDARACRKYEQTGECSEWTRTYGGKIVENIVQALARIVVADQMARISQFYKVVLQVHDEVVIVCREDEVEEAKEFVIATMSTPPVWAPDLPVACEADVGDNYGETK